MGNISLMNLSFGPATWRTRQNWLCKLNKIYKIKEKYIVLSNSKTVLPNKLG
jgi:hypothetical protein